MAPNTSIIFVPGLWEGPTIFDNVAGQLKTAGFETSMVVLPSTGTKFPGNPSMKDDIAAIRKCVERHVEQDKDVLLVLHSAGGFLGSNAIENLEAKKRSAAGKKGGVSKIVFLAAGILPDGTPHTRLPFADYHEDGSMTCKQPPELLYHDVPNADKWLAALSIQPAEGWDDTVSYTGWQHVPSVYVAAKNDRLLPLALQQQFAGLAQAQLKELDSGHMLSLVKPDEVVAIIKEAATA